MTNAVSTGRLNQFMKAWRRDRLLYLMVLPAIAFYVIFCYAPMPGLIISFKKYVPGGGMYNGDWEGLRWFVEYFTSPYAERTIRNTLMLSSLTLLFSFPVPIIFAICVTEIRNNICRRVLQTVSYLPYFISTVVVVGMMKNFMTLNTGVINQIIMKLGGEQINFFNEPELFRPLYVASQVWQSFGFNSIIYIAAIIGIDPSLYEASVLDGISKFQQVRYITIPMISNTIVILFILALGGLMSVGFEKVLLMYNSSVYETADVIQTYVYRKGIESTNYGYATAVGMFNSVVNFLFVYAANYLCRIATESSLW